MAADARWAAHKLLGIYPKKKSDRERVEWYMRSLTRLMGQAVAAGDLKEARGCIQAMMQAEKLRMYVDGKEGRPGGPALDVTEPGEQERRLEEARARRNRALGLEEEAEVVIDGSAEEKPE